MKDMLCSILLLFFLLSCQKNDCEDCSTFFDNYDSDAATVEILETVSLSTINSSIEYDPISNISFQKNNSQFYFLFKNEITITDLEFNVVDTKILNLNQLLQEDSIYIDQNDTKKFLSDFTYIDSHFIFLVTLYFNENIWPNLSFKSDESFLSFESIQINYTSAYEILSRLICTNKNENNLLISARENSIGYNLYELLQNGLNSYNAINPQLINTAYSIYAISCTSDSLVFCTRVDPSGSSYIHFIPLSNLHAEVSESIWLNPLGSTTNPVQPYDVLYDAPFIWLIVYRNGELQLLKLLSKE